MVPKGGYPDENSAFTLGQCVSPMTTLYGSTERSPTIEMLLKSKHHQEEELEAASKHIPSSSEDAALAEEEKTARGKAAKNSIFLVVANLIATLIIFILYLVSLELVCSTALTVGFTIYIYNLRDEKTDFDGGAMTFTLLSFAVVSPITATIRMGFKRREDALYSIADFRVTLMQIYSSHATWGWGWKDKSATDTGRSRSSVDWLAHSDLLCTEIFRLAHDLTRFLTLPNSTRARHKTTPFGVKEANRTNAVGKKLYESVIIRIGKISDLCEILKREGLPPNEATRIRQWERFVLLAADKLRMIKMYRTPQGLRSFGRLFSMILPPFYSPFFAELSYKTESLAIGIIFGVLTTVALNGLFETVSQFEDPFANIAVLDGVHVAKELIIDFTPQVLALRRSYFADAPEFEAVVEDEVTRASDATLIGTMRILNNQ